MQNKLVLKYSKTPLQRIESEIFTRNELMVQIKREDLNHPFVSGNKWWKLKYNLSEVFEEKHTTLLTFGGAFSNHLYATAAAARESNLASIGVVRGEQISPLNPTLKFAEDAGMKLHFVSRDQYRHKHEQAFIDDLHEKFGNFYLIPEGGGNQLALKGCEEFAQQLNQEADFDYLCLPVGTGTTMAGFINQLSQKVIGFSSLKGGEFLIDEVKKLLTSDAKNWEIIPSYHFGGYGKVNEELINFIKEFESKFNIPLDPVYTGKMIFGIMDLVSQNYFPRGCQILIVHTGGLQGRMGFNF